MHPIFKKAALFPLSFSLKRYQRIVMCKTPLHRFSYILYWIIAKGHFIKLMILLPITSIISNLLDTFQYTSRLISSRLSVFQPYSGLLLMYFMHVKDLNLQCPKETNLQTVCLEILQADSSSTAKQTIQIRRTIYAHV